MHRLTRTTVRDLVRSSRPTAVLVVALSSLSAPSCVDRSLGDDPDTPELWRFCTYAAGAYTIESDGGMHMLVDPQTDGHSKVCLCMEPDDYLMETFHDQVDDMALDACLEDAELSGYADRNTCQEVYESGVWSAMFERDRSDNYICDDSDTPSAGCGAQ